MTKAKLIAAKAMFRRNECDEQNGEELYMTYNADMLTQILSDTTLTSADFMAVKMLQEGAVNGNWLGFKWLAYEKLDSVTAGESVTTKTAAAWCKSAVHFGTGAEYNVDIGPRRDKNNTIQISVDASMVLAAPTRKSRCHRFCCIKPLVCLPGSPAFFHLRFCHDFQCLYLLKRTSGAGCSPINFDEDTDHARLCANLYPTVRNKLLRKHPWNCAVKRVVLSPSAPRPSLGTAISFRCRAI
jgi:hypothetical protein